MLGGFDNLDFCQKKPVMGFRFSSVGVIYDLTSPMTTIDGEREVPSAP